jgi:hypothetical protein
MRKNQNFIIVDLVGGLGNQLFGLAFGSAMSEKLNCKLKLDKSLIHFGSNNTRRLEIQNFDFGLSSFQMQQSNLVKFFSGAKNNFFKKISGKIIMTWRRTIVEKNLQNENKKINKRYSGYFQDWMFADYLMIKNLNFFPVLRNEKIENSELFQNLINLNPIIVHIRLGDYLKLSNVYEILPERYYQSAIEILIKSNELAPIWLIVEDLEQVKEFYPNLVNLAKRIIDKNQNLEDHEVFYLMTKSNNLVASNSTFSFWASWFILNNGGNVIVPSVFRVSGIPSKLIDQRWDSIDISNFSFIPKGDLNSIRQANLKRFNELFT